MGGLLASAEHRLKGYALVVGDGGLVTHFSGAWVMGLPEAVRREWLAAMWPIEPIHYVGCAAPAALLFQNGTLDTQVRPADALRYQRAGSEPKTIRWYEAGHGLNMQASLELAKWLGQIVGIAGVRMAFPASLRVVLAVWFLLALISLAFLAVWLWRTGAPRGARLLWLLATAFLGPLGLAAYWLSTAGQNERGPARVSPDEAKQSPPAAARRALGSAAWAAGGNTCGIVVVLGLVLGLQTVPVDIPVLLFTVAMVLAMLLLPFGAGLLVFAAARRLSRSDGGFSAAFRRPVLAELASTALVLAGAYPTLIALITRFFGPWTGSFPIDPLYAPLWGGLSLACLAGALLAHPFHWWMIHRGVIRWGEGCRRCE
jgi:hypothetical protein